jgi:D-glycero-D-manno-heptose 1,7-bisphosphate phosphatase
MTSLAGRAIFLDLDGVINYKAAEGDYVKTWRELQFIPGAAQAVAALNLAGYQVLVVTNQRGVATARARIEDLIEIHRRIRDEFARAGATIFTSLLLSPRHFGEVLLPEASARYVTAGGA